VCGGENLVVVVITIVIMIVPIALRVPAMVVFTPPATVMLPAIRAGFGEFLAPVLGFRAVPAMVFGGFVQFVIGLDDALLAIVIGTEKRSASPTEKCAEGQPRNHMTKHGSLHSKIIDHKFSKKRI
jgi:hypothetical protein